MVNKKDFDWEVVITNLNGDGVASFVLTEDLIKMCVAPERVLGYKVLFAINDLRRIYINKTDDYEGF